MSQFVITTQILPTDKRATTLTAVYADGLGQIVATRLSDTYANPYRLPQLRFAVVGVEALVRAGEILERHGANVLRAEAVAPEVF